MGGYLDDVNVNVVPSSDQFGDFTSGAFAPMMSEGVPTWLAIALGVGVLVLVFVLVKKI
jgi:hypothetical protein